MGRPASVCDRNLRVEDFGGIHLCARDPLAETSDFTDFLEEKYLPRSISINADTSRVVTTIFFTGETVTKDFTNLLPRLEGEREISRLSVAV